MTAAQAMRSELVKVQKAQSLLVDEYGIVKPYVRYEYQRLATRAAEIKRGMELLQGINY